jgi:hypothetical protein
VTADNGGEAFCVDGFCGRLPKMEISGGVDRFCGVRVM